MSLLKRRAAPAPAPVDHGLEEIAQWEASYRSASEEVLRAWPTTSDAERQHIAQRRAQVDAIANAITAERIANYLARTRS